MKTFTFIFIAFCLVHGLVLMDKSCVQIKQKFQTRIISHKMHIISSILDQNQKCFVSIIYSYLLILTRTGTNDDDDCPFRRFVATITLSHTKWLQGNNGLRGQSTAIFSFSNDIKINQIKLFTCYLYIRNVYNANTYI